MAYRFNPPPNWPIDDANWSPPPGWQPDPSWGPAPDGWNFWTASEQAPAPQATSEQAGAADDDDATRVASTSEQGPTAPAPDADDATRVASTGEQTPAAEQAPVVEQAPDVEQAAGDQQASAGQYGSLNPYGQAPAAQDAPVQGAPEQDVDQSAGGGSMPLADDQSSSAPAESVGRHAAEPAAAAEPVAAPEPAVAAEPAGTAEESGLAAAPQDASATAVHDDATHVADSGQRDSAAPDAAGSHATQAEGAAETAEYGGPDLEADLAQQAPYESAPYESAEPVAADDSNHSGEGSQGAGYGMAAGAAAAGGTAGAAAASGQQDPSGQGYGQASPSQGYGQQPADQGYGQGSPAQGYGDGSSAPAYGQASPAQGYGQPSPAQGYGQASPAAGYGQGSAPDYPGQGSASDYPAPGYGQNSPGIDTGSGWTASTGAGEPPKKGIIQRFWWIGCLIAIVLVLALIAIGGIFLFSRSGGTEAGGGGSTTTQEEDPTTDEPTDEETTEEEPTEEETTEDEIPIPTDLNTIDPAAEAEAINIVGPDGTGTMAVHMVYTPGAELERSYGGAVEDAQQGDYVVLTAKMTVTEGELSMNPFRFDIQTPYGGAVEPATASFGLKGSGTDGPNEHQAGEEYTLTLLFDVKRAGGNKLVFDSRADQYSWDVPA
ncbi:hypothetical protein ACT3SY_03955 [Brachybacterium sp. AOP42-E1-35]|uniref:hypothetical protein n=1 Tax=unclassified Brachybacterium TaxID=2623841 RepID=UPI00402ADFD4